MVQRPVEGASEGVPQQYFEMMQDLFLHSQQLLDAERSWSARMLELSTRFGTFTFEQTAGGTSEDDQKSSKQMTPRAASTKKRAKSRMTR